MLSVLHLDLRRLCLVRNLSVVPDDADRYGHAGCGTERKHGRRGHARVLVGIDALLHDCTRSRFMGLKIPMCFVERLPDSAEIRLTIGGARDGSGL